MPSDSCKRRYPRISFVSSRQIVHLDDAQTVHKNLVVTQNLSPVGICLNARDHIKVGAFFLVYLNNVEIQEALPSKKNLIKAGDYFLAQAVWSRPLGGDLCEIGATFFEREDSTLREVEIFTELVNANTLDGLVANPS